MTKAIRRRDFINNSLAAVGGAVGLNSVAPIDTPLFTSSVHEETQTMRLEQLDLSKVQVEPGTTPQLRSDKGVRLPPGANLWIDLKGAAKSFTATLALEPNSGARSILCRFFCGPEYRQEIVWARGWSPRTVTLPLTGRDTLVIETEFAESKDGITVLLRDAAIAYSGASPEAFVLAPIGWDTPDWRVTTDGRSGAVSHISSPRDPHSMNWIRPTGRWGTGLLRLPGSSDAWLRPASLRPTGRRALEVTYRTPALTVVVRREIDTKGWLRENYTFTNNTGKQLQLDQGSLGIFTPLNDRYPGADICLTRCCHAHVWPGGQSAYINAFRMGGVAPHLGLVVTGGAITEYSIENRPESSNDRGWLVMHPETMTLAPGKSGTVSWALFWHEGWDDFFAKAMSVSGFIRLEADEYTVLPGKPIRITASAAASPRRAKLLTNGKEIPVKHERNFLKAEFLPVKQGSQTFELVIDGKQRTLLHAFVTTPPMDLIRSRVEFIIKRQQKSSPGDPLDGAYLIYDNETDRQVYGAYDHNAGRERLAMGVLGAMYLPHCQDKTFRAELIASLERYNAFVRRELQDDSGTVFDDVGRQKLQRLYNYPWVAHLHLEMYHAKKEQSYLQWFVRTCRTFYEKGGERFYPIGLPIFDGLKALEEAGLKSERDELLALFCRHADAVLKTGIAYPKSEVNYEQSIVGPAVQILLETYLATKKQAYLEGARVQLACLEAFNGRQPDYRLNDIAIRHWDDFWFGKRKVYADTQPHYWSTITAIAFKLYAEATGQESYARRAQGILRSNLCYFTDEGRAYCAYVNPLTVNGRPGQFFDPWANDQDWALVNWLTTNDK